MQRCPTCEFVYEEDQNFCDMDGATLIHDPEELPRNLPTVRPRHRSKPLPRMIAIVVIPNILLAALLFYGTTQQVVQSSPAPVNGVAEEPAHAHPSENESFKPPEETEHSSESNDTDTPSRSVEGGVEPAASGIEPSSPSAALEGSQPINGGRRISSRPATPSRRSQAKGVPPKKDSKVSSVLKKTGRILKKPFRW